MNASELHELVKDWPEGAKPPRMELNTTTYASPQWVACSCVVAIDHAVLLHEASASVWLARHAACPGEGEWLSILAPIEDDSQWYVEVADKECRGPTLLHALDAAIRATGGAS